MKTILCILILALAIPTLVAAKEPAQPVTAETIQILKISAQDQRAVIMPDGKMQIIKVGDVIDSRQQSAVSRQETVEKKKGASSNSQVSELRVVEITKGRVVFEEKKGDAIEKIIIRLVDGKQKVERMRKADEVPQLYTPLTVKEGFQGATVTGEKGQEQKK